MVTGLSDAELLIRVRKLLVKAEATANIHEADAFARKAAELIARHRIDPERLAAVDVRDDLVVREFELGRGAYVRARLALLSAIAHAHDVRVVFQSRPEGTVALAAGYRSDLELVALLYASLHQQAASQMSGIRRQTGAATQRFRRSFLFGFADRIAELMDETRRVVDHAAPMRNRSSAAVHVAVQERTAKVEAFAGESFGRVRTARTPSSAQPGAWDAGAAAAGGADIGRSRLAGRRAIGRRSGDD